MDEVEEQKLCASVTNTDTGLEGRGILCTLSPVSLGEVFHSCVGVWLTNYDVQSVVSITIRRLGGRVSEWRTEGSFLIKLTQLT